MKIFFWHDKGCLRPCADRSFSTDRACVQCCICCHNVLTFYTVRSFVQVAVYWMPWLGMRGVLLRNAICHGSLLPNCFKFSNFVGKQKPRMKIIVVESAGEYNKPDAETFYDVLEHCPRLWLKADSALLKNNNPFFVPDFTRECSASVYVALRICRMGKSIAARFARRYYDAWSVAVDFTAEDVLRQLRKRGEPWDMAKSFDSSVAMGGFVELKPGDENGSVSARLEINGVEQSVNVCDDICSFAGRVIEDVSRVFTVRQGDFLLVGSPKRRPIVKINDHLDAFLNGRKLLDFNIK